MTKFSHVRTATCLHTKERVKGSLEIQLSQNDIFFFYLGLILSDFKSDLLKPASSNCLPLIY